MYVLSCRVLSCGVSGWLDIKQDNVRIRLQFDSLPLSMRQTGRTGQQRADGMGYGYDPDRVELTICDELRQTISVRLSNSSQIPFIALSFNSEIFQRLLVYFKDIVVITSSLLTLPRQLLLFCRRQVVAFIIFCFGELRFINHFKIICLNRSILYTNKLP